MKSTTLPNTIGVPKLLLIGPSGAAKSSLIEQLIPLSVKKVIKISGESSGQTTLTPTEYYLQHSADDQNVNNNKVIFTIDLRTIQESNQSSLLDENSQRPLKRAWDPSMIRTAIIFPLLQFIEGSPSNGLPKAALTNFIEDGKYVAQICTAVSGAVRLNAFKDDAAFQELAMACGNFLLSNEHISISELDSALAAVKNNKEKQQVKLNLLRDQFNIAWDAGYADVDSPVRKLLSFLYHRICERFYEFIPEKLIRESLAHGREYIALEMDLSEQQDQEIIRELLNPYSPFCVIVKKYRISCSISKKFQEYITHPRHRRWFHEKLPFRVIITDTAGLTQDTNADAFDISGRLRVALNNGCDGILFMMPNSTAQATQDAVFHALSNRTEEGRQIRKENIDIYASFSKIDEEITPKFSIEDGETEFYGEMRRIKETLEKKLYSLRDRLPVNRAQYITTHPKKIKPYLDDLKEIEDENEGENLSEWFDNHIGVAAMYEFIYEITYDLQMRLFPNGNLPIFYRAADNLQPPAIKMTIFTASDVQNVAAYLKECSKNYKIDKWLHWNTAYAARSAMLSGTYFQSRAEKNGRITITMHYDVTQALQKLREDWSCDDYEWQKNPSRTNQIDISNVVLNDDLTKHLLEAIGLDGNATHEQVQKGLYNLMYYNFSGEYFWRFSRVVTQVVARLSCTGAIHNEIFNEFDQGLRECDASWGVQKALTYYRSVYQAGDDLAAAIATMLNQELTNSFNNFFFPVYS